MVTAKVIGAIAPKLEQAEIERSKRKPTGSLDAYDYYLRGQSEVLKWTRDGNEKALAYYYRQRSLIRNFLLPSVWRHVVIHKARRRVGRRMCHSKPPRSGGWREERLNLVLMIPSP